MDEQYTSAVTETKMPVIEEEKGVAAVDCERHLVLISKPRVDNCKMLVMLNIRDWDQSHGFYYPLENIDCKAVMIHVMWKLSGDESQVITTSAEMDILSKNCEHLNLRNWRFA